MTKKAKKHAGRDQPGPVFIFLCAAAAAQTNIFFSFFGLQRMRNKTRKKNKAKLIDVAVFLHRPSSIYSARFSVRAEEAPSSSTFSVCGSRRACDAACCVCIVGASCCGRAGGRTGNRQQTNASKTSSYTDCTHHVNLSPPPPT